VQGETKEQWLQLCELAAVEKDPQKLMAIVKEINRLLQEKEQRLRQPQPLRKTTIDLR